MTVFTIFIEIDRFKYASNESSKFVKLLLAPEMFSGTFGAIDAKIKPGIKLGT